MIEVIVHLTNGQHRGEAELVHGLLEIQLPNHVRRRIGPNDNRLRDLYLYSASVTERLALDHAGFAGRLRGLDIPPLPEPGDA